MPRDNVLEPLVQKDRARAGPPFNSSRNLANQDSLLAGEGKRHEEFLGKLASRLRRIGACVLHISSIPSRRQGQMALFDSGTARPSDFLRLRGPPEASRSGQVRKRISQCRHLGIEPLTIISAPCVQSVGQSSRACVGQLAQELKCLIQLAHSHSPHPAAAV